MRRSRSGRRIRRERAAEARARAGSRPRARSSAAAASRQRLAAYEPQVDLYVAPVLGIEVPPVDCDELDIRIPGDRIPAAVQRARLGGDRDRRPPADRTARRGRPRSRARLGSRRSVTSVCLGTGHGSARHVPSPNQRYGTVTNVPQDMARRQTRVTEVRRTFHTRARGDGLLRADVGDVARGRQRHVDRRPNSE